MHFLQRPKKEPHVDKSVLALQFIGPEGAEGHAQQENGLPQEAKLLEARRACRSGVR